LAPKSCLYSSSIFLKSVVTINQPNGSFTLHTCLGVTPTTRHECSPQLANMCTPCGHTNLLLPIADFRFQSPQLSIHFPHAHMKQIPTYARKLKALVPLIACVYSGMKYLYKQSSSSYFALRSAGMETMFSLICVNSWFHCLLYHGNGSHLGVQNSKMASITIYGKSKQMAKVNNATTL
jgi:hypothetical protein